MAQHEEHDGDARREDVGLVAAPAMEGVLHDVPQVFRGQCHHDDEVAEVSSYGLLLEPGEAVVHVYSGHMPYEVHRSADPVADYDGHEHVQLDEDRYAADEEREDELGVEHLAEERVRDVFVEADADFEVGKVRIE